MNTFFSEQGLTSTSANHIANLAKEFVKKKEIDNISFINKSLKLISSNETPIEFGTTDISNIPTVLEEIAQAKSLIAWLREAIKARKEILSEVESTSIQEYCELIGEKYPEMPKPPKYLKEEEYYSNLPIKERNRYFQLETICATIGKFIHPNGTFANARAELIKRISKPIEVDSNGSDTLIYRYIPTMTVEDVDDMFFKLQAKHREAQAELNGIKHKAELALEEDELQKRTSYNRAFSQYTDTKQKLEIKFEAWLQEESTNVRNLKITIPNDLKEIYEKVKTLGK